MAPETAVNAARIKAAHRRASGLGSVERSSRAHATAPDAAAEDMFGLERTAEVVRRGGQEGVAAAELVDRLVVAVREFAGEEPQADDMTCVVVRVE